MGIFYTNKYALWNFENSIVIVMKVIYLLEMFLNYSKIAFKILVF